VALNRDCQVEQVPNLHLVWRTGMHHYNNQDHSMMTALLAARTIATSARWDPWKVNADAEYLIQVGSLPNEGGPMEVSQFWKEGLIVLAKERKDSRIRV
jgi:hypothetical protein